jgi:hypothetical protein
MKKILWTILLTTLMLVPVSAMAGVSVGINIPLPPPIVLSAPPPVVVLPNTPGVYAAPGVGVDLFFYGSWWWQFWNGRWYRSPYWNRGWVYYNHAPGFYHYVNPHWRAYYGAHNWNGRPWNARARYPQRGYQGGHGYSGHRGGYGGRGHERG